MYHLNYLSTEQDVAYIMRPMRPICLAKRTAG